jgi:hypothetical protein
MTTIPAKAPLTHTQQESLLALTAEVDKLPLAPKQRQFCDVPCLLRYLRARDYNVKKALKLLSGSLEWRAKMNPDRLDARKLETEAKEGKLFQHGFDKLNRPLVYMIPGRSFSKDHPSGVQLLIYTMERAIQAIPQGGEQLVWFIDFKGFTKENSIPISVAKETLDILANQYPERLGACFFIDTPQIFNMFYRAITPFINSVTRQKVHFVNGTMEEKKKILMQYFDVDQLSKKYGGTTDYDYVHDVYWKEEMEKCAKLFESTDV